MPRKKSSTRPPSGRSQPTGSDHPALANADGCSPGAPTRPGCRRSQDLSGSAGSRGARSSTCADSPPRGRIQISADTGCTNRVDTSSGAARCLQRSARRLSMVCREGIGRPVVTPPPSSLDRTRVHERQGAAITNFRAVLPPADLLLVARHGMAAGNESQPSLDAAPGEPREGRQLDQRRLSPVG